jgi:hypothetical protein
MTIVALTLGAGSVGGDVVGLAFGCVLGARDPLFASPLLLIRYNATMPVVSPLLAFRNRYIGFACSDLKTRTCAHFIGIVAV